MGFFKKIFKPVSKVLDKIIPNEIKPALPYLAAFAPYFGPTSSLMGKGIMQRALISGGLNIGGQLAQEGSEGDINLLSAGLGALSGAMTAPGAADSFAGSRIVGTGADGKAITASEYAKLSEGANLGSTITSAAEPIAGLADPGFATQTIGQFKGPIPFDQVVKGGSSGITGLAKAKNIGLTGLEKGSKFISEGMAGGLKDKAQVLAIPAATATGDVLQAEARQLEKQQIIDDALAAAESLADAGMRGDAIRNAMRSYGFFSDDEIESTVSSAGYRAGGRVGFDNGGDVEKELDTVLVMIEGPDGVEVKEVLKSEALRENLKIVSDTGEFNQYRFDNVENKKAGGRVGFRFGGIDEAIETIQEDTIEEGEKGIMMAAKEDPMLVEEYNKYVFDLMEQRPDAKPMSFGDFKRMIMSGMKDGGIMATEIPLKEAVKNINKKGQPDTTMIKMKEGGLMDLGGKEMDLRGGGFVPIGKKEKADDVPARLSKNEFVMTADAVRAAGGGSVNEGAKRMYETMNKLEARA